ARLVDELRATQAELARTSHDAGVLAERERVAQEIHDTLAQGFTSVVMLAQAASADLDRGAVDDARERLGLVESTARDNLAEARALAAARAPAGRDARPGAASPRGALRGGDGHACGARGGRRSRAVERGGGRAAALGAGGADERAAPRGGARGARGAAPG